MSAGDVKRCNSTARLPSSAATTNATSAKVGGAELFKIIATNTTASLKYLKIYNKASAPTVGTDVPVLTIALPPSNALMAATFDIGLYCNLGIAYAITGAAADADATAVAAGDVVGLNLTFSGIN